MSIPTVAETEEAQQGQEGEDGKGTVIPWVGEGPMEPGMGRPRKGKEQGINNRKAGVSEPEMGDEAKETKHVRSRNRSAKLGQLL